MLRFIRRLAVVALAGVVLFVLLPSRSRSLPVDTSGVDVAVRGAVHIHTLRSDGTGTVADVTRAAARAGLRFVIVTDHGDATRAPDPPDYRDGVLYIDATEISTTNGHVVALGLPQAPYPLGGEARDVLEDITRLGGFSVVAHPGSAKRDLSWTAWDAPFNGLEWLNGDSEWRDESWRMLLRTLFTFPFRAPESLALLLDRPEEVLRQWDALTMQRRVVAVAGSDAHARVGLRTVGEPYDSSVSLRFPSYDDSFRGFSITVDGVRLTGEAAGDAEHVLAAIREGHAYSSIEALAHPAHVRLTARSGSSSASMGDTLDLGGPVTLRVETHGPPDARITLLRNGRPAATASGLVLEFHAAQEPAVFRAEVALPGAPGSPPVPWIVSNPIYVGRTLEAPAQPAPLAPSAVKFLYNDGPAREWGVEKSTQSDAAIDVVGTLGGSQLLLRFALSGTASDHPYAAFTAPATAAIADYDRVVFTARADRPMRLSVQLRAPGGEGGRRWRRSVYVDQTPRAVAVRFADLRPIGSTDGATPVLADIQSVLFVVDAANTRIGSNGQIWIDNVAYAR